VQKKTKTESLMIETPLLLMHLLTLNLRPGRIWVTC